MTNKNAALAFSFFLVGASIGAGVTLLAAPKSGKETRKFILRRIEDGRDYLEAKVKQAGKGAEEILVKGREFATKYVT